MTIKKKKSRNKFENENLKDMDIEQEDLLRTAEKAVSKELLEAIDSFLRADLESPQKPLRVWTSSHGTGYAY